jgi:hypothetical protein
MDKKQVEHAAVALATGYLERLGYAVRNVSRVRGHNGYDLLASRADKRLTVEVKGCTRPWGIPDPYVTEFDASRRLVADYLYVVYFLDGNPPRLCTIPRDAIDPSMIVPKQGWKIRSTFKNAKVMARYMVDADIVP